MFLWELLTQEQPYAGMPAHQVISSIVEKNARPAWPTSGPAAMHPTALMLRSLAERCWSTDAADRPHFGEVLLSLRSHSGIMSTAGSNHSVATDPDDELEIALRAQKAPRAISVSSKDRDGESYSGVGLNVFAMPAGLPKDELGKMLYHLCQMPSQVRAVEHESADNDGVERWVCSVDMIGQLSATTGGASPLASQAG
ncbi:hypothetical protein FOA52_014622 [Chlamydomonas sp. UWO 241]|nr:hypothetical protein FOA52_014622 [Chlamydomonas sp. UWO 241]